MMVYDLVDFMILNIKSVDYRCFAFNMSKNTAIKLLNKSQLNTVEVIKEGGFGGTYLVNIYSDINSKWSNRITFRESQKEFDQIKCRASLRFWKNKGNIKSMGHYGWFQWYFKYWSGRRSLDSERQIARWKSIVSRFNGRINDSLFYLKLDKFYCTEVMNELKVSCYWFNSQELLQKAKDKYHNCGGNKKAAEYYLENKEV